MSSGVPISVVIPAFNAVETIEATIRSVLAQVSPAAEIIVVDDGSTDGTVAKAESFSPAVKVVAQSNQGSAAARQHGTERAVSPFIAYLDADDWWDPLVLQKKQALLAKDKEIIFMFGDLRRALPGAREENYLERNSSFFPWVEAHLNAKQAATSIEKLYKFSSEAGLDLLLRGFPVFPSTVLVKKSAVMEVGGWDSRFRRCQDFDIALRLASKFGVYFHNDVDAILGVHEVNEDARAYVKLQTNGDIYVLRTHLAETKDNSYRVAVKQALARKLCRMGTIALDEKDISASRAAFLEAVKLPGKKARAALGYLRTFDPRLR